MSLLDDEYCECHLLLRQVWDEMTALYEVLSPHAQLAVHQYYRPSEDLSRDRLLDHRRVVTQDRPDLEVAAQWAYQQLQAAYEKDRQVDARSGPAPVPSAARRNRPQGKQRQLRVRAAPRAEPDLQLLADALIDLALDEGKSSADDEQGGGN